MLLYFVLSMHTEQHTHTLYVPLFLTSICKPHPQKAHLSLLTLSANFSPCMVKEIFIDLKLLLVPLHIPHTIGVYACV